MITSVNFCPISCNGIYYLVSTSTDGSVAFWSHTKKGNERAVFQLVETKFVMFLHIRIFLVKINTLPLL